MTQAVIHHYFPLALPTKPDLHEAIRAVKREQLPDINLIDWGQSFVADSSGGRRHQIKSIAQLQPKERSI